MSNGGKIFTELAKVKSISDIFKYKFPSFAEIKKENGDEYLQRYLKAWFVSVNKMFNDRIELHILDFLTKKISIDFYFLNQADLKIIQERLTYKKFVYLNAQEILQVFNDYFNERCEAAAIYSQDEKNAHEGKAIILNDKDLKKFYKDIKKGKPLTEKKKELTERDKHRAAKKYYEDYLKSKNNEKA